LGAERGGTGVDRGLQASETKTGFWALTMAHTMPGNDTQKKNKSNEFKANEDE